MRGKRFGKWFLWGLAFLAVQAVSDAKAIPGNIVPVGRFAVNLAGGNLKDLKTLQVTAVLELNKREYARNIRIKLGQIKWEMILFFSGKSLEEVNSRTKRLRLRKEIIVRLNTFLKKAELKDIFFTEFVIR